MPSEFTPQEQARIAVATELRRLSHELVRGTHDADELLELAEQLATHADTMATTPTRQRDMSRFDTMLDGQIVPGEGEEFINSADRPVSGPGNPWSIPLRVFRRGDRAVTEVVLGPAHEGAPTMSHGGVVAAIFDDLLGFLLVRERRMAFTAWIRVDYKNGTPVGQPVRFEAWIERVEGKKLFLAAEGRDGSGELLTTCEALFVDATERFRAFAQG